MKKFKNLDRIIKTKIDLIIVAVSTTILSSIIVFIFLDISNGNFDNLVDWIGALGSIGAIFAVIYQVHKQREEFLESNRKDGEVCFNVIDELDGYSQDHKFILKYWVVNTGNVIESYRFIGFVDKENLKSLINSKNYDVAIQFMNGKLYKNVDSNVEALASGEQSEKRTIDIKILKNIFDKEVYIVYKSLSGDFYFKKFIFSPKTVDE